MAMLKSLFYLLIMLVVIIVGLTFLFRNHAQVDVDLLFFQASSFSIGSWLLTSLIVGVVIGIALVLPNRFIQSFKIHQLSKKLTNNEASQTRLKTESTKGS